MGVASTPSEAAARLLAGPVAVFAAVVASANLLGVPYLPFVGVVITPMAPLTAVLVLLLGLATFFYSSRRLLAHLSLAVAACIAALVMFELFTGTGTGMRALTLLLFNRRHAPLPELPDADTASAVILLALSLASYRTRYGRLHDFVDITSTLVIIVCLQVLIGFAFNITFTSGFTGFRQVAPQSTASVMLLAMAITARRPDAGLFAAFTGPAQSAAVLRRLLPVIIVVSVLRGWLQVIAMREGVGGTLAELAAWSVTMSVVVIAIVLFVTSVEMRRAEALVAKRQEELEAATIAAEAASEAKSRFMAVMSHELRTPLTAVIGYADLIEATAPAAASSDLRRFSQRIRAAGWHLVGLIDSVLFYAGGKLPASHTVVGTVDLVALIRDVLAMFGTDASDHRIELRTDLPDAPVTITADQRMLRQVLVNLISNAIKFTDAGHVSVRLRTHGPRIIIDVSDTGIGIQPDQIEHIWQPFSQVDETHTRTRGGLGLGLTLTHRLVEQLGGGITVTSTPHVGTTFRVELSATATDKREETSLDGVKVLVVEDEAAVRRIIVRTLERHGAVVQEADSGHAAVQSLMRNDAVQLMLTDISMPGMNGIELARAVSSSHPDLPILFVTGAVLTEREQQDVATLGVGLLHKPFDMQVLTRTVRSATARTG